MGTREDICSVSFDLSDLGGRKDKINTKTSKLELLWVKMFTIEKKISLRLQREEVCTCVFVYVCVCAYVRVCDGGICYSSWSGSGD